MFIPGLIFLFVNATTSHMFYHVNSYKVVLVILGVTFFAFRNIPLFPSTTDDLIPWKIWGIMAIPLLATFPGLMLHRLNFNYNFRYELATNLVLLLWVIYLCRNVRREKDLGIFIFFIGITVIYSGVWSVLEKTGFHPLASVEQPVEMVKATFGHRNYFSGFLIILLPTLLIFAIPEKLFLAHEKIGSQKTYTRIHLFYTVVFLFGVVGLLLAQTRAAIAAFLISLALVSFLYVHFFAPHRWQKRLLILFGVGIVLIAASASFVYVNPNLFAGSRFAQLLTFRTWVGRLLPWETAISSIKASPLVGFGLGSSYNLFFTFVDPDASLYHFERSYNHAHSEILEYLQESGLIGMIAFIIFWAYLIYLLIRLLRNSGTSTTQLKLGIGIAGGFLAYHIHGSFSVAPRMMVMKLPIYTLIALTLILNKINTENNPQERPTPSLRRRTISGLPTLGVLIIIWTIFLPWAAGQYHFVRIQNERQSYLQTGKMEQLVRLSPDIYALDHLARLQIQYKKIPALKRTLDTIERIIPHYRDLGYKKTLQAAMSGDQKRTKELALAFQQRDRYHLPNIDMLMKLSVQTDDLQLFKKQFELFLRKQAFAQRMVDSLNADDLLVQFLPTAEPLKIISQPNKLTFQWSEQLIAQLFATARSNHHKKLSSAEERQRYGSFLFQLLAKSPYFRLTVLDSFKGENPSIQNNAKAYFELNKAWEDQKRELDRKFQSELSKTPPALRGAVVSKREQAMEAIRPQYETRINKLTLTLREKTDWDLYLSKQKFISTFVNWLNAIIFIPRS
ncbi:MAG: O-antigen ligase family protein [SAR324 cluster bacterium]|nr:O-antigen ligase family protein [SAR324 cluster bacterium]